MLYEKIQAIEEQIKQEPLPSFRSSYRSKISVLKRSIKTRKKLLKTPTKLNRTQQIIFKGKIVTNLIEEAQNGEQEIFSTRGLLNKITEYIISKVPTAFNSKGKITCLNAIVSKLCDRFNINEKDTNSFKIRYKDLRKKSIFRQRVLSIVKKSFLMQQNKLAKKKGLLNFSKYKFNSEKDIFKYKFNYYVTKKLNNDILETCRDGILLYNRRTSD